MKNTDDINEMVKEIVGTGFLGFLMGWFIVIIFFLLQILPIYLLWNWLMPTIFHLPEITLLQSCGLYFLSFLLIKNQSWIDFGYHTKK